LLLLAKQAIEAMHEFVFGECKDSRSVLRFLPAVSALLLDLLLFGHLAGWPGADRILHQPLELEL